MDKRLLRNILRVDVMQEFQDLFANAVKIGATIVDTDGYAVTEPSRWNSFCESFLYGEETGETCKRCVTPLLEENRRCMGPSSGKCAFLGTGLISVPIILEGTWIGSWVLSQFRLENEPADAIKFEDSIKKINMSRDEASGHIALLRRLSEGDIKNMIDFIHAINASLVELRYTAYQAEESRKNALQRAKKLEEDILKLNGVQDSADAALLITDYFSGEILMANEKYCEYAGLGKDKIVGEKCYIVSGNSKTGFCRDCPRDRIADENGQPTGIYSWTTRNDENGRRFRCTSKAISMADGRLAHVITQVEVTQEYRQQLRLAKIAYYDKLTGLPNGEKLVRDMLESSFDMACKNMFLICLNFSSLHELNGEYGQGGGAVYVKKVAAWLKKQGFNSRNIYSINEHSFAILVLDEENGSAIDIAEQIARRFTRAWEIEIGELLVSFSAKLDISIIYTGSDIEGEDILSIVDLSLLAAVKKGDIYIYDCSDASAYERLKEDCGLKNGNAGGIRPVLLKGRNRRINLSDSYTFTASTLKLVNQCLRILFTEASTEKAFEKVFENSARHFDLSRVFVFLKNGDTTYKLTREWCAEGIAKWGSELSELDLARVGSGVLEIFMSGGIIDVPDLMVAKPGIRDLMDLYAMRSLLMLPMFDGRNIVGLVGFSDAKVHSWLPEELIVLQNLCLIMSYNSKRGWQEPGEDERKRVLTEALSAAEWSVFISDLETDEILWTNEAFFQLNGIDKLRPGDKCHELIHKSDVRCDFCVKNKLRRKAESSKLIEETVKNGRGTTLMVSDRLISWDGDRLAHINYCLDITKNKSRLSHYEYLANIDSLTGSFSRAAFLQNINFVLKSASERKTTVSIAYVDLDGLKHENDTKGHKAGDNMIKGAVEHIRSNIRESDIIGRMGGDEFVVVLENCGAEKATAQMEKARNEFFNDMGFTFSYGIAENSELPYADGESYINDLLEIADRRMLKHKRQNVPAELRRE